jgi:hypothetical protein
MCGEPIRDQHAVALKVDSLSAHASGARMLGKRSQLANRAPELGREHVVGVIAKAGIAHSNVRRVVADFLAVSPKRLHPTITDSHRRQTSLKRLAIELRQPPRHRKRPDVDQSLNSVSLKRSKELVERPSRMTDSEEPSQRPSDAEGPKTMRPQLPGESGAHPNLDVLCRD